MKVNVGKSDRIIRVIIGVLAIIGGYMTEGTLSTVLYAVGALGLITGAVGVCGIYMLLGISTCPTKK